jgi:peptidoglycan/xylan/chitin deacetylase (PgdA/CDA1 family)
MATLLEGLPLQHDKRTRRQHIAAAVDTMMSRLLYDDRRGADWCTTTEDHPPRDLRLRDIENAILQGEVTIDEIVEVVREALAFTVAGYRQEIDPASWRTIIYQDGRRWTLHEVREIGLNPDIAEDPFQVSRCARARRLKVVKATLDDGRLFVHLTNL